MSSSLEVPTTSVTADEHQSRLKSRSKSQHLPEHENTLSSEQNQNLFRSVKHCPLQGNSTCFTAEFIQVMKNWLTTEFLSVPKTVQLCRHSCPAGGSTPSHRSQLCQLLIVLLPPSFMFFTSVTRKNNKINPQQQRKYFRISCILYQLILN